MKSVSLHKLVDEMQTVSDEIHGYLNRVTGEIVIILDEHIRAVENEEDNSNLQEWERAAFEKTKEVLESENYLELPNHFKIDDSMPSWKIFALLTQMRLSAKIL